MSVGPIGGGGGGGGTPSARSQSIHDHLLEIERRLDLILGLVEGSTRLKSNEKEHYKGVFEGVKMICLAECKEGPTDYYPEID